MGAAGLTIAAILAPLSASAAEGLSGNWWYDSFGVAEVQAEGWDGSGVKVAVVDRQINAELPVFAGAALTVSEPSVCGGPAGSTQATSGVLHGTQVAALLVGNGQGAGAIRGMAPGADVTFYGWGDDEELCRTEAGTTKIGSAIRRAVDGGAQIITTSVLSNFASADDIEAVADALARGVIIVAGMPNGIVSYEAEVNVPTSMNGVVSVAAFGADGVLRTDDVSGGLNVHPEVTVVAPGDSFASINWVEEELVSGTSFATPLVAGILAVTWQKYPDATGNQLIQSLIHNTGREDHPLERSMENGFGYGAASLRHMLAVDPSQYPDENPLMDKASAIPTTEAVAAATAALSFPASTNPSDPGSAAPTSGASSTTFVPWLIGGGCVVFVLALVLILVLVVRRNRTRTPNGEVT